MSSLSLGNWYMEAMPELLQLAWMRQTLLLEVILLFVINHLRLLSAAELQDAFEVIQPSMLTSLGLVQQKNLPNR